jgi:hypothetical protein
MYNYFKTIIFLPNHFRRYCIYVPKEENYTG